MLNYKIFVIYHDEIIVSYYDKTIIDRLVFINVNPHNKNSYQNLNIINLYELENFVSLGKWYAESEVIYNVYKNAYLIKDLNYVGFIHYDIDFTNITDEFIQNVIGKADLINLQPYIFKQDYKQKILMDINKPNTLRGVGKNCYLGIFEEYNDFFKTDYKVKDYFNNEEIALCNCFIIKASIFDELMLFIKEVIESRRLDKFDIEHNYRIQGGLLERYIGVWFLIRRINSLSYKLKHEFSQSKNEQTSFDILKRHIKTSKVYMYLTNR